MNLKQSKEPGLCAYLALGTGDDGVGQREPAKAVEVRRLHLQHAEGQANRLLWRCAQQLARRELVEAARVQRTVGQRKLLAKKTSRKTE